MILCLATQAGSWTRSHSNIYLHQMLQSFRTCLGCPGFQTQLISAPQSDYKSQIRDPSQPEVRARNLQKEKKKQKCNAKLGRACPFAWTLNFQSIEMGKAETAQVLNNKAYLENGLQSQSRRNTCSCQCGWEAHFKQTKKPQWNYAGLLRDRAQLISMLPLSLRVKLRSLRSLFFPQGP